VRTLAGVAAAFVLVAVLVGALARGGGADPASGGEPTSSSSASSARATPETVAVVAADLLGRQVTDVQAELVAHGLQVQLVPAETSAVAAGVVTAVSPEGELARATAVTVTYAVAPVVAPAPAPAPVNNGGNGHGKGHGKKD
jgi:serine/threonine-protein kinase